MDRSPTGTAGAGTILSSSLAVASMNGRKTTAQNKVEGGMEVGDLARRIGIER